MKISIVTVVYNNESTVADAIRSVLEQTHDAIEYIVIDGASSDGTMEVINSFKDRIDKVVSEPDKGIYDAMNKGLSLVTGEVVGILNSDDFYHDQHVISSIIEAFKAERADAVYGDLIYVDAQNTDKVKRYWKSGRYERNKFLYGWMPPHPTFFVKREVYQKYGQFNLTLKSAADYEFMLRVLYKHKISAAYVPKIITTMRDGGNSNASLKSRLKGNREDVKAWELNGISPSFFTRYLKPLRKIGQFVAKPPSSN